MKRTLGGIPVFAVMILILVGMLQFANWIPSAIQEGALQRYKSIDEVRSHLTMTTIFSPVYYPRSARWPPSLIAAQSRPYLAVVTEYQGTGRDEVILVVTQTERLRPPLRERIVLSTVRERVSYPFKGRTSLLEVGFCSRDERCSRISWDEGAYTLALAMKDSPVDLVRIAESMIAGTGTGGMQHSAPPELPGEPLRTIPRGTRK
jgi:hypothetical protein